MYFFCPVDTGPPELDGRLRLVDGTTSNSGRLEIFKNGLWGTVCSAHFTMVDADVACRQLQYSGSTDIIPKYVYTLLAVFVGCILDLTRVNRTQRLTFRRSQHLVIDYCDSDSY